MIDNYAIAAILLRSVTSILLIVVLRKQFKLLKKKTKDQWIKYLLTSLVLLILCNAIWSLVVNFFRNTDGNLMTNIRHLSLVFNSTSGLLSAIGWVVLYKGSKE